MKTIPLRSDIDLFQKPSRTLINTILFIRAALCSAGSYTICLYSMNMICHIVFKSVLTVSISFLNLTWRLSAACCSDQYFSINKTSKEYMWRERARSHREFSPQFCSFSKFLERFSVFQHIVLFYRHSCIIVVQSHHLYHSGFQIFSKRTQKKLMYTAFPVPEPDISLRIY